MPINRRKRWQKSSRSLANGNCVEVQRQAGTSNIIVRDTQDRRGVTLQVNETVWFDFIKRIQLTLRCGG